MGTTYNILDELGDERHQYREVNNDIGIVVGSRTDPRMLSKGLEGYILGLVNDNWRICRPESQRSPTPNRYEKWVIRIIIGVMIGVAIIALAESMI